MKLKTQKKRLAKEQTGVPGVSLLRLLNAAAFHGIYITVEDDKFGKTYWTAWALSTGRPTGLYHPWERFVIKDGVRTPVRRWQECLPLLAAPGA